MSDTITVYHNISCSKSSGAVEILAERNIPFRLRYYLNTPLSEEELRALLQKLNLPASAIVRRSEALAAEITASGEPSEEEWIQLLAKHPVLIERPIVERGDRAIVARPPEKVLELLT